MKTGKYIPLGTYNNVKIGYGTVNFKSFKSIYLKFNSWVQPNNTEDFEKIIRSTRRDIKKMVYDLKDLKFKPESIVDVDIRTKGIKKEKRSFMNLEITLYVNEFFDVKSKNTKNSINNTIVTIIDKCLDNKTLYNFHKTKK